MPSEELKERLRNAIAQKQKLRSSNRPVVKSKSSKLDKTAIGHVLDQLNVHDATMRDIVTQTIIKNNIRDANQIQQLIQKISQMGFSRPSQGTSVPSEQSVQSEPSVPSVASEQSEQSEPSVPSEQSEKRKTLKTPSKILSSQQ